MSRLRIQAPGPGFVHLPEWVDAEYCEQLTAEKGVRKYLPGRGVVRQWIKTRERNEALDLEVYALAVESHDVVHSEAFSRLMGGVPSRLPCGRSRL